MIYPLYPGLFGTMLFVCAVFLALFGFYFLLVGILKAKRDVEEAEEREAITPHTGIRDVQVLTDHGVEHRYENRSDDGA